MLSLTEHKKLHSNPPTVEFYYLLAAANSGRPTSGLQPPSCMNHYEIQDMKYHRSDSSQKETHK